MGTLAVFFALIWQGVAPILGANDGVGLYLSRTAQINSDLIPLWFIGWVFVLLWLLWNELRRKEGRSLRTGLGLALLLVAVRFASLGISKALAVWWGGTFWIGFLVAAIFAAVWLAISLFISLLLVLEAIETLVEARRAKEEERKSEGDGFLSALIMAIMWV